MGSYNARSSDNTTNEDSKEKMTRTEQPMDDIKKEKKQDNNVTIEQDVSMEQERNNNMKRPHDKEQHEERTAKNEVTDKEVQIDKANSQGDHHVIMEDNTVQDNDIKKKIVKRNTQETVMAARERYLARKRIKLEATQ